MENRTELEMLRRSIEITQAEMAKIMGISVRGYEELEAGRTQVKDLHLFAARYAAIQRAIDLDRTEELPVDLRNFVGSAALLMAQAKNKPEPTLVQRRIRKFYDKVRAHEAEE